MTTAFTIAPVVKTLTVNAAQAHAFEVFVSGIDRWWPKSHTLRPSPLARSVIEPKVGGRWYTVHEDGGECVVGHMRVFERPHRIVFTWEINAQWQPDTTVSSEVEVIFTAEGPNVTRVQLEHRKFEALGQEGGQKMRDGVGSPGGWSGILELFKAEAER
jgi:uncharacterized protein YndB with AHSA1/START domain